MHVFKHYSTMIRNSAMSRKAQNPTFWVPSKRRILNIFKTLLHFEWHTKCRAENPNLLIFG